MVLINGVKFACERCIRGHRVSSCNHTNGDLIMIKKKGRPSLQCPHCREQRKVKNSHSACVCGKKGKSPGQHSTSCGCHKTSSCICGSKSTTERLKRLLSPFLPRLNSLVLSDSNLAKASQETTPSPSKNSPRSYLPPSCMTAESPQLASLYSGSFPGNNNIDPAWNTKRADASLQYQLTFENQARNNDMDLLLGQYRNQINGATNESMSQEDQAFLAGDAEFLEFFGVDNALLNSFPGHDSASPVQVPTAAKVPAPSFPFYETHDSAPIPHRELIRPYRLRHGHSGDGRRAGASGLLNGGHSYPISPVQQRSERRLASRSSSISTTSAQVESNRLHRPPSIISLGSVSSNRSTDHASTSHYTGSQQNLPNITNSSAFPPTDYFSSGDLSSQDGDHKPFSLLAGPTILDAPPHSSSASTDLAPASKWGLRDGVESFIDEEPPSDHNDHALIALISRRAPINNQLLRSSSQMLYQQLQRMPGVTSPHRESDLYKMFQDDFDHPKTNTEQGSDLAKPVIDNDFGQAQLIADDESFASLSADPKAADLDFFGLLGVFDNGERDFATT